MSKLSSRRAHIHRLALALSMTLGAALTLSLATATPSLAACVAPKGITPMAASGGVSEVGANSAVLEPSVCTNGYETVYELEYSITESGPWIQVPNGSGSIGPGESEKTLHVELVGLSPETRYYVRVLTSNVEGKTSEIPITFTTEGLAPRALGTDVSGITETSAEVQGELKPHLETQWRLEYTSADSGSWIIFANGTLAASDKVQTTPRSGLVGLAPATTYYVRESLINEQGKTQSQPVEFETIARPSPSPPSIVNESVSSITERAATLEGQINPEGTPEVTYIFEYGDSTAYGLSAPTPSGILGRVASCGLPCGDEDPYMTSRPISVNLTGLEPGTTYHYRVLATSTGGTSYGKDATFTTAPLSVTTQPEVETPPTTNGGGQLPSSTSPSIPGIQRLYSPPVTGIKFEALTRAQKLAKALNACEKKPKKRRSVCRRQADRRYARSAKKISRKVG